MPESNALSWFDIYGKPANFSRSHGVGYVEAMRKIGQSSNGFARKAKMTRKREFLEEMNQVLPWATLVGLVPTKALQHGTKGGRPPFAVQTMLRIHLLQHWFNLSDPAMEEALYDTPMFREFAHLETAEDQLPDERDILRFRHVLETQDLCSQILAIVTATLSAKGLLLKLGAVVDAALIAAPASSVESRGGIQG